ncbi:hypothetical protein MLD38_004600 [Melastoma candidum]|uniref:Uncharacterized protein n=1 Tax=Melastoma candidum TaxID=119954 RepID=A0ACB9SA44_9MYRT|nr:hypothetical protein MLD38_004600 [Melastoma candidum]
MVLNLVPRPALHSRRFPPVGHFAGELKKLCEDPERLRQFQSVLTVNGLLNRDGLWGREFVRTCFHVGKPSLALSWLKGIEDVTLPTLNLMLKCLPDHGLYEDLLWVYRCCRIRGRETDGYGFPLVIKAARVLGEFGIGREVHCAALRNGFGANVGVQTAFLDFYAKMGHVDIAEKVFGLIPEPDLVCWNALIAGLSLNGSDRKALEVFGKNIWGTGLRLNSSTLASIVPVCTRVGCVEIGRSLHGYAIKSGCSSEGHLVSAFMSMYAKEEDLCSAVKLFVTIEGKGIGIGAWNALIHAYADNMREFGAFDMFCQMLRSGNRPDPVTLVSVIPACARLTGFGYCECVHAFSIKCGLEMQVSVGTALVSTYAKQKNMIEARFLFDEMPKTNPELWNSIISGYVYNGLLIESLSMFREMNSSGVKPDAVSIVNILSACSKVASSLLAKSAHAFSLKMDFASNINVANALMESYSVCGGLGYALMIFDHMTTKDTVSWNTLISGCIRNREPEKFKMLVHQMQKEDEEFDFVTLISILSSCDLAEFIDRGMSLHCFAIKKGFAADLSSANAFISMYANCGDFDSSRMVFETMSSRDIVSWNALLTGCRKLKADGVILAAFHEMIDEGQTPDSITLINLLPSCSTALQGRSIHAWTLKWRLVQETSVATSLITMYAKFNDVRSSLVLFEMGDKWNVSLWNAMIFMYIRMGNFNNAVLAFRELLHVGVEADHITFLSLISAASLLTDARLSHSLHASVVRRGLDGDLTTANALIDMYARSGNLLAAGKLFNCLVRKDTVSWNVMINAQGLHGNTREALALLSWMEDSGFEPNSITYLSVLSSCRHSGSIDDASNVCRFMIRKGMAPMEKHLDCLVDLLGRAGRLSDALSVIKDSPRAVSPSSLKSLLGACFAQSNVQLAEEVGKMLHETYMDKSELLTVMLHNTYAASGRWIDASRVRSELDRTNLRKIPGCSLLCENL